ncbi:MAG TPA: aminotransferase class III-fold pyridoxal phosphate-dependent enzyme [Candidatus Saccharimonadia bacterium]|nr:aminotransferase class III-fold pyridoxal phosphate-dependent enzyme [Candidatus Saccharimonadia bacterium]
MTLTVTTAAVLAAAWRPVRQRIELSLAKHRSLTGHSRMAKRFAAQVPGYSYGEDRFFSCDGAPAEVQTLRRAGFAGVSATLNARHEKSVALTKQARERVSDLQFTGAYRVPFQFSRYVRENFSVGGFLKSADGVNVTDLDGERLIDLTGSYGVNVFGHDFYKSCMAEGSARAADMGMVLGSYHPAVAWNAEELCRISGMDEVSFHMSGTEAVMQAVRLARYHTRRKKIVRFCGAYHGWWDDVQPGPGNPMPPGKVYTLKEMGEATLRVLRKRRDIACVLVNPLQALHPNGAAPGDGTLIDSSRSAHFNREAYTKWLRQLREVCTANGIVLIFDEVFLGFRLALGGAQEYFGVKADMVTYGKTLGGGFPVGVVCGRRELMKRFRDDRPADMCFARGTFNSHPHVMAAMQVFLERLQTAPVQALYAGLDDIWNQRVRQLNQRLLDASVPVTVSNLSTVWTVSFTQPSRYNWMLQFYLRAHRLALSWVGTGRLIFTLNFTDEEFAEVSERFVTAAKAMQADGWWWQDASLTNKSIKQGVLREVLRHRFKQLAW